MNIKQWEDEINTKIAQDRCKHFNFPNDILEEVVASEIQIQWLLWGSFVNQWAFL